ncbi:hypothetical protein VLK31_35695 [Variovorax sp. H27-G14]|uniref:hypothetical protein n=1 Tax=Variovorax sp. H27-G14 TaxID=3111914 RepID=UPI0038FD0C50
MDFTQVSSSADFSGVSVALLAICVLLMVVLVIEWSAKRVLALLDGGVSHEQAFWSDGEQRTSMDAVYERAAAMAAAGEGQSDEFRHSTVTAAYDAGYSGRFLGDSVDPATSAAWNQARADRAEDDAKGWN